MKYCLILIFIVNVSWAQEYKKIELESYGIPIQSVGNSPPYHDTIVGYSAPLKMPMGNYFFVSKLDTINVLIVGQYDSIGANGMFKYYYENGTIKQIENFTSGIRNGYLLQFDSLGILTSIMNFINSIPVDFSFGFSKDIIIIENFNKSESERSDYIHKKYNKSKL